MDTSATYTAALSYVVKERIFSYYIRGISLHI